MRFTEHELTAALTGAAKSVLAAQDPDVLSGKRDLEEAGDEAWEGLGRYQRYQILDSLGDQLLPALVALPDVEVEPGTRPTFTDEQVTAAVEERLGDGPHRVPHDELVLARVALVKLALECLPPRQDPDALIVPDHL